MATQLWRTLKPGDKIRLVGFPPEFLRDGSLHPETKRVYQRLLSRRRPLRVFEVKHGGPWVECRFRRKDGRWESHYLMFNHSGIVRVKHRKTE